MNRKTHYGMSAETAAARAPFTVCWHELPKWMPDPDGGGTPVLCRGWIVRDKNGDKTWPTSGADVGVKFGAENCANELNLAAAKWLMENEGPAIDVVKESWEETNRYRK